MIFFYDLLNIVPAVRENNLNIMLFNEVALGGYLENNSRTEKFHKTFDHSAEA